VNGLPLVIIELKNAADADATIWTAYQQLHTYKAEIPSLFNWNEVLVISDGLEARLGTLTAGREWCKPWRTIAGKTIKDEGASQLEIMLKGIFDRRRFLSLVRDFIVFEDEGGGKLTKKTAGYHQFHAVHVAVEETLRAAALQAVHVADEIGRYEAGRKPGGKPGDRRIGVVWHTQGSGKSLTMAFYVGRIIAVRAAPAKRAPIEQRPEEELDHAIRQIISRAIAPEGLPVRSTKRISVQVARLGIRRRPSFGRAGGEGKSGAGAPHTFSALLLRHAVARQAFDRATQTGKLFLSRVTVGELNDVFAAQRI
jgi:hypothetical protein